jgi:DNA-binding NarL/FixJ family response regulator
MIRVILVNEIRLMCNVISSVLAEEPDIDVIGATTNLDEALQRASNCDVMLLSTRLPENGALRLTQAVTEMELPIKVLVMGLSDSEVEILQYVEAGAAGYILKDDSVEDMLRTVRAVYSGEAIISPEIAAALMARVTELAQLFADVDVGAGGVSDLTPREREILGLIGEGYSNREISEDLIIEVGTVKNHVHSILKKLNVSSRQEAAAYWALLEG